MLRNNSGVSVPATESEKRVLISEEEHERRNNLAMAHAVNSALYDRYLDDSMPVRYELPPMKEVKQECKPSGAYRVRATVVRRCFKRWHGK